MSEYIIRIKNGRHSTYDERSFLRENNFKYSNKCWEKTVSDKNSIKKWSQYARKKGYRMEYVDKRYVRSNDYRKEFFSHYKPFFKTYYFCIYCGKLLSPEKIAVDHIIPVHGAETHAAVRRLLKRKGFMGVNDYRNLGASCYSCNQKKGSKMNGWVFRGYLGKSNVFQVIRLCIRVAVFFLLIILIYHLLTGHDLFGVKIFVADLFP